MFPEKPKNIDLKFGDIYKSPEWQKLGPIERGNLILVAEGVKPGTVLGVDAFHFVKKMGLGAHPVPNSSGSAFKVAKKEVLQEMNRRSAGNPNKEEGHRIAAAFFGYPACCTEEYIKPEKNLEARKQKSPEEFLSNVDFEMEETIRSIGSYPEELDFLPATFTPCGAHCENALRILGEWRDTLQAADPKAARELQVSNWRHNESSRQLHQKELKEIEKQEQEARVGPKMKEILISIFTGRAIVQLALQGFRKLKKGEGLVYAYAKGKNGKWEKVEACENLPPQTKKW